MPELMEGAAEQRLTKYFDRIGEVLARPERRASFANYALGILGEGERKSIEPIAARACADPDAWTPSISGYIISPPIRRGMTTRFGARLHVTPWRR